MQGNNFPTRLPKRLHRFFWDVDVASVDLFENPEFVISRLLDKGDFKAVKWVEKTFTNDQIKKTLITTRDFSLRSASFWALIYQVPLFKVKCFQEPYLTTRRTLWPY